MDVQVRQELPAPGSAFLVAGSVPERLPPTPMVNICCFKAGHSKHLIRSTQAAAAASNSSVRTLRRGSDASKRAIRFTELVQRYVEQVPVLIEDLDALVSAVGHIQAPLGVERHRVRHPELPGSVPDLPPLHNESSIGGNFMIRPVEPGGMLKWWLSIQDSGAASPLAAVVIRHKVS